MKTILIFLMLVLGVTEAFASNPLPEWADPQVFRVNKEPARSFFYPHQQDSDLYSAAPWQASNYQLLNGEWKFNWVEKPALKPENFHQLNFDDSQWGKLAVPANVKSLSWAF